MSNHSITKVRLFDLDRNPDRQARVETNPATVELYAEHMRAGATFPPVEVYFSGEFYFLADGWHRVAAAELLGLAEIDALVREGDVVAARLAAAQANRGLGRTNADKRRSVHQLLDLKKELRKDWSDRKIAEMAGVSHIMVASVIESRRGNVRTARKRAWLESVSTQNPSEQCVKPESAPQSPEKEAATPVNAASVPGVRMVGSGPFRSPLFPPPGAPLSPVFRYPEKGLSAEEVVQHMIDELEPFYRAQGYISDREKCFFDYVLSCLKRALIPSFRAKQGAPPAWIETEFDFGAAFGSAEEIATPAAKDDTIEPPPPACDGTFEAPAQGRVGPFRGRGGPQFKEKDRKKWETRSTTS